MTDTNKTTGGPCCAHLTVVWKTEQMPGGMTRGWWECEMCHAPFIPEAVADVEIRRLRVELGKEIRKSAAQAETEPIGTIPPIELEIAGTLVSEGPPGSGRFARFSLDPARDQERVDPSQATKDDAAMKAALEIKSFFPPVPAGSEGPIDAIGISKIIRKHFQS